MQSTNTHSVNNGCAFRMHSEEEERKLTAPSVGVVFLKNEVLLLFFIFLEDCVAPNPFSEGAEAYFSIFSMVHSGNFKGNRLECLKILIDLEQDFFKFYQEFFGSFYNFIFKRGSNYYIFFQA